MVLIQIVILHGHRTVAVGSQVGIGSTEALEQRVEVAGNRLRSDNLCHIGQRCDHLGHTMDETVGAPDVGLCHLDTIDAGITCLTVGLAIEQEIVVVIRDAVVGEPLLNELQQRHLGIVCHTDDGLTGITQTVPVTAGRHLLRRNDSHRVELRRRSETTHTLTLLGRVTLHTGQGVELHRVVHHAAEEQQLLLRSGKLAVVAYSPAVVRVEPVVSGVIGHKQRLRTRLGQHFTVAKVIDHAHRVGVVALLVEPTVDARTPAIGSTLIQVVFFTRRESTTTCQQHSRSQHPMPATFPESSFGFHT